MAAVKFVLAAILVLAFLVFLYFKLYPPPPLTIPHETESPEIRCRLQKNRVLATCRPRCEADPNQVGEAFDACLSACSQAEFGIQLPVCTPGSPAP